MKTKKRFLAILLCLCMVATLLSTTAFAADGDKTIMLDTKGISSPTAESKTNGTYYTPNDYIYFGKNGNTPIKWRVLDADKANDNSTAGMFLLSEYLLARGVQFEAAWDSDDGDGQTNPNEWQHSDAQEWCKNFASNQSNFSQAEQGAMLGVEKTDSTENDLYSLSWGESSLTETDKMFFLSVRELADYVGSYDKAPGMAATFVDDSSGVWWLRSPYHHSYSSAAGAVGSGGGVASDYVEFDRSARPAFNLNLTSVLFTSAAVGGKIHATAGGDAIFKISDYTGNEWKLTLLDDDRNFSISNAVTNNKGTIGFSYSGAQTGENEYISVVIKDSGAITHYGRILQLDGTVNGENGIARLTLPEDVNLSDTTELYVFNEQYNGDYKTDYASQLIEISNPVADDPDPTYYYTLTFNTNGGSKMSSIRRAEYTTIDLTDYTPTREGYEFTGWYADEDLTKKITSIRLTRNTTVYAGWEEIKENPFTDVSESDWFFNDVKFVYQNGLMNGTSGTTFSPYGTTTRAMVATTLWRMEGESDATDANGFTDVENGKWYTEAITWAAEKDITEGYGNGIFGTNDPVTREQLAGFFYNYAKYKGYDTKVTGYIDRFTDKGDISDWAARAMKWAVGYGLIEGKDNNILDPQGYATRAEFAAMLHRFVEKNDL